MTRKTVKDWLDDPALTQAERALIDAVRAGKPCALQDDPETVPEADDDPAHTIRADLLALLITGGTAECGLAPFGVGLAGAYVKGELRLPHLRTIGETMLVYCRFSDEPDFRSAHFQTLYLNFSNMPGLNAQDIRVGAILSMMDTTVKGCVTVSSAKIGGQLNFTNAKLHATSIMALNAQGVKVEESLFLENSIITGEIDLDGAKIGGQFSFREAKLDGGNGNALNAQRAIVTEALIWQEVNVTSGRVCIASANVGDLWDNVEDWPDDIILDGFSYERLIDTTTSAQKRLPWLAKGSFPNGHFTPQPYTQLAKVLREMGHDREARIVLMERERLLAQNLFDAQRAEYLAALNGDQTRRGDAGQIWISMTSARAWAALMRVTTGYGYAPQRALVLALVCVALGTLLYFIGYRTGLMVPNSAVILTSADWAAAFGADATRPALQWQGQAAQHFETFYPIPYALDVFVPVVDLGQHSSWTQTTVTPWGAALRWFTWALQGAGYLITGLGLAAATGIIQKDRG